MIDPNAEAQLEKVWMVSRIVWAALLGTLGVYLLVAEILEDKLTPVKNIPFELLKNILFGISVAVFIAAFFIRKSIIGSVDDGAPAAPAKSPSPLAQAPGGGRYFVAIIASCGLSESIGICGFVLFILGQDSPTLYQFIGISALAMLVYRPRKDEFLQLAGDMKRRAGSPSGR